MATGHCVPATADCHKASICGAGTVCNPDGTCGADCRGDLLETCGYNHICNQKTGVCDVLSAVDCRMVPSICWEDQTCDTTTGYCAEAAVDAELDYDVQLYDVTIDVDTTADTFTAVERVFFKATKDNTTSITLDVGATASGWTPYTITDVADHNGTSLSFNADMSKGTLTVPLAATLASGAGEVLTVKYGGPTNPITDANDPLYLSGLMHRVGNDGTTEVVQTYGWPNVARRWLPSHDHPSDAARAIITVGVNDAKLEPIANGVPVGDQMANGFHRKSFVLRQPVPTYALFVGAAPFTRTHLGVVDGVSIDTYTYAADASIGLDYWTGMLGEMHYLSQRFGQYPFERYAVLEIPDPLGGMEHATVVDIADWWIEGDPTTSQDGAIHEMIHHWWGDNARQRSWEEFWLNESMASYFTIDTYLAETGPDAYQHSMDQQAQYMFGAPQYYTDDPLRYQHATEEVPGQSTNASLNAPYQKGPWFWHMLRGSLGEDKFWAAVKAFYDATRFKKYDTQLLLKTVNSVSGADYTQFFHEWVYQRGWPVITTSWTYDAAKQEISVTANQVQDPAWGTYTFTGASALEYDFDDTDKSTPTCKVSISFTGGATTATAKGTCAYAPAKMSTPFTSQYLIQLQ
jgi:aminopeptidase N